MSKNLPTVQLIEKSASEIVQWLPWMFADYVAERIGAGEDPASAQTASDQQRAMLFPGGRPAEGQYVMNVVVDDIVEGTLWMGRPLSRDAGTWYVFNIAIDEGARERGVGRATMVAAEAWARDRGGSRIGLNVFGPNVVARSLYDSLGFRVLSTSMTKDLT